MASIPVMFAGLTKKQQGAILFGVPAAIALTFAYLAYTALGELGPHHEKETLPGFLQRTSVSPSIGEGIAAKQIEIDTQQKIAAELPAVTRERDALLKETERLETRLPRQAEKAPIRDSIEQLAREILPAIGSVRLLRVRINEGATTKGGAGKADYQPVTYETELEGDMNGIIEYIRAIEQNERFMLVNALTLRSGGVTVNKDTRKIEFAPHAVKMDIVTYAYTPANKAGR